MNGILLLFMDADGGLDSYCTVDVGVLFVGRRTSLTEVVNLISLTGSKIQWNSAMKY